MEETNQTPGVQNESTWRVQVDPPQIFSFQPHEWPSWKKRFERFRTCSGLESVTSKRQVNTLIYTMGDRAEEILTSFNLSREEEDNYDVVVQKFENYFIPMRNKIYERACFLRRKQQPGESVDSYTTSLHTLSKTCEWGNLADEMKLMALIVGMCDQRLSDKLQLDPKLTFDKALTQVRLSEEIARQRLVLHSDPSRPSANKPPLTLDECNSRPKHSTFKKKETSKYKNDNKGKKSTGYQNVNNKATNCRWCGYSQNHADNRDSCPAKDAKCNNCGIQGHFVKVCRRKKVAEVLDNNQADCVFIGSIKSSGSKPWMVTINIHGKEIDFKVDTGADVTVLPATEQVIENIALTKPTKILCGPDKRPLDVIGVGKVNLKFRGTVSTETVYVVQGLDTPLLGRPAITSLKILGLDQSINPIVNNVQETNWKQEFKSLFTGLGTIPGDYKINVDPGATPKAIFTPRSVALPLLGTVKKELDNMVKNRVIAEVEEATDWCAPMVVVPKPAGGVRICVDLTHLNRSVKREIHPIPKIEHTLGKLAGAKVFSKLDANAGFWQVPLDPESQHLTTFLSPFGRFKFLKLPFGISSAPEHFQRKMNIILQGLEGVEIHMDDIIVWGSSQEEHDRRLRAVLERLEKIGMTLNEKKTVFSVDKITFLGHKVSAEGIAPDEKKISAIVNMEAPLNVTEVQRFLGMVNFLGKYIPRKAEILEPINSLLSTKTHWIWGPHQEEAFKKIKTLLTSAPILALYDPTKTTIVSADASSYGLGGVLLQEQDDGKKRPIAYVSRSLSAAEKNYANIEREALALTWSCERLKDFITGMSFSIETDHKPLVPLFTSKNFDEMSPRLQRFRMRMMRYSYKIFYSPGKDLVIADTLSRKPLPCEETSELEEEMSAYIHLVNSNIPITDTYLAKIIEEQNQDPICTALVEYTTKGWPSKNKVVPKLQAYWSVKDELSINDNLLMRGTRLLIPESLQKQVLEKIHEGHQGITKCRARAREAVWWPGISTQIEFAVRSCPQCVQHSNNSHEPMIASEFPSRAWQIVAMDLFKLEQQWYLVVTDYYSRYFEIAELSSLKSRAIINHCKSIFSRHGIPETVRSDNGPQFGTLDFSEFKQFSESYGFKLITSSPKYSQSNGFAEAAVKIAKLRLKKSEDPFLALLAYRTTPLANGLSPAELLMNRKLRSTLPLSPQQLDKVPDKSSIQEKEKKAKEKQKRNFNQRHRCRDLSPLQPGDPVWIIDMRIHGKIVREAEEPRSYIIQTARGILRRNRWHLVPAPYFHSDGEEGEESFEPSNTQTDEDSHEEITPPEPVAVASPSNRSSLTTVGGPQPCHGGPYQTKSGRRIRPPMKLDL